MCTGKWTDSHGFDSKSTYNHSKSTGSNVIENWSQDHHWEFPKTSQQDVHIRPVWHGNQYRGISFIIHTSTYVIYVGEHC